MTGLLIIVTVWFGVSIPVGLATGRVLATANRAVAATVPHIVDETGLMLP